MNATGSICLVLAMMCGAAAGGPGARGTDSEMAQARAWAESAFAAGSPCFSMTYGDRPLAEQLPEWSLSVGDTQSLSGRTTRAFTFGEPGAHLEIVCTATQFTDFPAVEWVLTLSNQGREDTPILADILPLDWRGPWPEGGVTVHHSLGDSNDEKSFTPLTRAIAAGEAEPFVLTPKGGRSSDGFMPFFNIEGKGRGVAMAVGWSGQWRTGFDYADASRLRVTAGMETTHLLLHPGETIRTPRMLLVFWEGDDPFRGNNLLRQVMMAHYLPRRNGELVIAPTCASVTEVDPDGSYEGPHAHAMTPRARRGIEVFWSDMDPQQWYPVGFPEGTGTWEPDPVKYPNGLKPVGDAARAANIEYLLWFEPERVAKNTRIAQDHPEWVSKGAEGGLFRLDIPEARAWITEYVDAQVSAAQISWMRWDFNIEPLKHWKMSDAPDRQGMTEIGHITGLYAMWDTLCKRHPGMVIDLCASGGRRNDLESLMRGVPLWHSDMHCFGKPSPTADQLQNAGLFRWIPFHGCAGFELEPSYSFRSSMTTGNILVPLCGQAELEPVAFGADDAVVRTVALYKKIRPYFLGDYYPLFPHSAAPEAWFGYQFHRADLNAGMAVIYRREGCAQDSTAVQLKGLAPEQKYEVTTEDDPATRSMTGAELAAYTVTAPAPASAVIVYYKAMP